MSSILFDHDGGIARITLNRPGSGNAIDLAMAKDLLHAALRCDEDDDVRCVILTGAGRQFCVGGDVVEFAEAGGRLPHHLKGITAYLHAALVRFLRMPKPVITAINGPTAGAGIGLAMSGDIVLADPNAHFTLAYTALGVSPDGGSTWLLPRLVGLRKAQELCLTNRRVSAEEAQAIGLITRMAGPGELGEDVDRLSAELASGAMSAIGATKRLLIDGASVSLEAQLEAESRAIAAQGRTFEGKEGIAAFVAKRSPEYGRKN